MIEAGWRAAVGAHQDDTTVYAGADIRLDTEVSAMSFPLVLRAPVEVLRNLLEPDAIMKLHHHHTTASAQPPMADTTGTTNLLDAVAAHLQAAATVTADGGRGASVVATSGIKGENGCEGPVEPPVEDGGVAGGNRVRAAKRASECLGRWLVTEINGNSEMPIAVRMIKVNSIRIQAPRGRASLPNQIRVSTAVNGANAACKGDTNVGNAAHGTAAAAAADGADGADGAGGTRPGCDRGGGGSSKGRGGGDYDGGGGIVCDGGSGGSGGGCLGGGVSTDDCSGSADTPLSAGLPTAGKWLDVLLLLEKQSKAELTSPSKAISGKTYRYYALCGMPDASATPAVAQLFRTYATPLLHRGAMVRRHCPHQHAGVTRRTPDGMCYLHRNGRETAAHHQCPLEVVSQLPAPFMLTCALPAM